MALDIRRNGELVIGSFRAMASPCEVLVECDNESVASELIRLAHDEALRIERKFSRYRDDNIIHQINHAAGQVIQVDQETARLLDFSQHCYEISEGLFDVTSGILRQAWTFDGSDQLPEQQAIDELLTHVGWGRVDWSNPQLRLPDGMEIDLGGIGKEYAVDRSVDIIREHSQLPVLVNFGGDLHCTGPRQNGQAWITGIENPDQQGDSSDMLQLFRGALATSGDAYRYLQKDGIRYGHILNPATGWPDIHAPRSITVAAANCTEAGILATLAMLQGSKAEEFLRAQDVRFWISA